MTSPYLDKPRRALDQALRDRGMTPADVGVAHRVGARRRPSERERRALRRAPAIAALGGAVAIGLVVLCAALVEAHRSDGPPPIAEDQIDALQQIAPAAGPTAAD